MKRSLFLIFVFSVAVTGASVVAAQTRSASGKRARSTQKSGARAKKTTTSAEASKTPASHTARSAAERPKVREIKETGLQSLLARTPENSRPLLVNFWATWCTPCRDEFPDLVRLRAEYAPTALDFITVSLDDITEIETGVPQFLQEVRAASIPSYLLNADDSEAAINFIDPTWHGELPATFLYDAQGTLVFKHRGRIKPEEVRAAIEKALAPRQ